MDRIHTAVGREGLFRSSWMFGFRTLPWSGPANCRTMDMDSIAICHLFLPDSGLLEHARAGSIRRLGGPRGLRSGRDWFRRIATPSPCSSLPPVHRFAVEWHRARLVSEVSLHRRAGSRVHAADI